MQVINLSNKTLKYQTKGTVIVLNPGENNINDDPVIIKKLKDCYGRRIRIVDETKIAETYNAFSGNAKPVEPPVKEEVKVEISEPEVDPETDSVKEEGEVVNPEEEGEGEEPEVQKEDEQTPLVETEVKATKKATGKKKSNKKNK